MEPFIEQRTPNEYSAFALFIGLSFNPAKFLSANDYNLARSTEAHTDFSFIHLQEKSVLLGSIGLFLALGLVAQLTTLLMAVKSKFARTVVAGHLAILSLATAWSILANLGYVAMPGSGAPFPFISYSGSLLMGQLALLGMSAGLYRRRTLSLIECEA